MLAGLVSGVPVKVPYDVAAQFLHLIVGAFTVLLKFLPDGCDVGLRCQIRPQPPRCADDRQEQSGGREPEFCPSSNPAFVVHRHVVVRVVVGYAVVRVIVLVRVIVVVGRMASKGSQLTQGRPACGLHSQHRAAVGSGV